MFTPAIEKIDEEIRVVASFSAPTIRIHFFYWHNRIYKVKSTNMFHIATDENAKTYHFSVTAEGNDYELSFNPINLHWRLIGVIDDS
ncbi:MAG TPA: hypothetical protein VMQ44_02425 [Candidatus Saccharimonadales bacterium]|nr:hypothetical protein [Candidatus Saccharimonadales bacterium]